MGIGFRSGIFLNLVLLQIVQMRSSNPIGLFYGKWEVCNDLNGVCAFF